MLNPAFTRDASEADESNRYCTCCKRLLKGKIAWLEFDQRTDTYHQRNDVPKEDSQGWFPFGIACAKRRVNAAQ